MPKPIPVGIAIVRRNGCYLVRQRPHLPGSPMPGLWEFPGGKCEPGETPAMAAARECREEAGIEVIVDRLRMAITHHYPHGLVNLHYFDCDLDDLNAEPATGSGFSWASVTQLAGLTFPEANERILAELGRRAGVDVPSEDGAPL